MSNPLNKDALRALLKSYFGRFYMTRLAPVLGVSRLTIYGWVHYGARVKPIYFTRLAAYTPRKKQQIREWTEQRIERLRAWEVRKLAELDEAEKTLLWAAESAKRNSRKPKENSSL